MKDYLGKFVVYITLIVGITPLVAVFHELGHIAIAKLLGQKILKAVFFPPSETGTYLQPQTEKTLMVHRFWDALTILIFMVFNAFLFRVFFRKAFKKFKDYVSFLIICSGFVLASLFLLVEGRGDWCDIYNPPALNVSSSANWITCVKDVDSQGRKEWNETFVGNTTFYIPLSKASNITVGEGVYPNIVIRGLLDNHTGSCSSSTSCTAPDPDSTYHYSCDYYVGGAVCYHYGDPDYDIENYFSVSAGDSSCTIQKCIAPGTTFPSCPTEGWHAKCKGTTQTCAKGTKYTLSKEWKYRFWESSDGSCSGSYYFCKIGGGIYYNRWCSGSEEYEAYIKMSWNYYWNATNPWIDVADSGEPWEWSYSGEFHDETNWVWVDLNGTLINEYLETCVPNENNVCNLPVKLHSDTGAKIEIAVINITLEYNITDLYTVVSEYVVRPNENITKIFWINSSGRKNPFNTKISIGGYWLPFEGDVPTKCEVDGQIYDVSINGSYAKCPYEENISAGDYYSNKTIKLYKKALVTMTQTKHYFYQDKIIVDEPVSAYYNATVSNQDSVGYDNVFVETEIPLPSVYSNATPYTFITSLAAGEAKKFAFINITGTPVKETEWKLSRSITDKYYQYVYEARLHVYDGNVSSYEICYKIPVSRLENFTSREAAFDTYEVDSKTTGFSVGLTPDNSTLWINVSTSFGASSLEEGDHTVKITYYVEKPKVEVGGGGAPVSLGDLIYKPKFLYVNLSYEKPCKTVTLNLSWTGVEKVYVDINASKDIEKLVEHPKRVAVEPYKVTRVPIKVCINETLLKQVPVMVKGISGYIELKVRYAGGVTVKKVPVEIRVYKKVVPPTPKPIPPKPAIPIEPEKLKVAIAVLAFVLLIWILKI